MFKILGQDVIIVLFLGSWGGVMGSPRNIISYKAVLLKLWSMAGNWAADIWLLGHGLTPRIFILIHTIGEYGTAFILTLKH